VNAVCDFSLVPPFGFAGAVAYPMSVSESEPMIRVGLMAASCAATKP